MKDVVLGIDQSIDRATSQAETVIDLFEVEDIRVCLLHDFVDNPEGASVMQIEAVKRAKELLEAAGVSVELRGGSGDPAESIIVTAEELDADAICVAGRSRTPAGKMLFGSVTQSVVLNTERPVLVCSENEGGG